MYLWRLLKMLLFGGQIALGPEPVDIDQTWKVLAAPEPVVAINQQAKLLIDVTHLVAPRKGVISDMEATKARFPYGCVQGRLHLRDGRTIELRNSGMGIGDAFIQLYLQSSSDLPLDVEFTQVEVRADCPVTQTKVAWENAGK